MRELASFAIAKETEPDANAVLIDVDAAHGVIVAIVKSCHSLVAQTLKNRAYQLHSDSAVASISPIARSEPWHHICDGQHNGIAHPPDRQKLDSAR
jgi:hypothetical protein